MWPKYCSFSFATLPINSLSRPNSINIESFVRCSCHEMLSIFLQHHISKALILFLSDFFKVHPSTPYWNTAHTIDFMPLVNIMNSTIKRIMYKTKSLSLRFNGHFPGELGLASVYWSKGWWRWKLDYWSYKSCKAPVKSSPPTNQHPVFYRPDALPVAQPTVSKHWRENITFDGLAYPKLTWGSSMKKTDKTDIMSPCSHQAAWQVKQIKLQNKLILTVKQLLALTLKLVNHFLTSGSRFLMQICLSAAVKWPFVNFMCLHVMHWHGSNDDTIQKTCMFHANFVDCNQTCCKIISFSTAVLSLSYIVCMFAKQSPKLLLKAQNRLAKSTLVLQFVPYDWQCLFHFESDKHYNNTRLQNFQTASFIAVVHYSEYCG